VHKQEFYKNIKVLDEAIASGILHKDTIELIKDSAFSDYLFKRLHTIKWYFPLKEAGYFKPEKAPGSQPADKEGFYSIPEWNVLPYLEKISEQIQKGQNEKYIEELLGIIKDVTAYHVEHDNALDNYRTWWYFVKILVNLPNEKITDEIINLIRIWLNSKFGTELQGTEITEKLFPKFLNSDDPADHKKAEKIIEFATTINWEKFPNTGKKDWKQHFLTVDSYWLQKAFAKHGDKAGQVCSIALLKAVANQLFSLLKRIYSSAYAFEHNGRSYRLRHSLLDNGNHGIRLEEIKFPGGETLDELMPEQEIPFMENELEFEKKVKEALKEKVSNIDSIPDKEIDDAISAISSFEGTDASYMWYPSFNKPPRHIGKADDKEVLTYILFELLKSKAHYDAEGAELILKDFLSAKYQFSIFKRILLFIISTEWDNYKQLFFRLVTDSNIRCFEGIYYERELSRLLKNNSGEFTPNEKEIIKKIIMEGPIEIKDDGDVEKRKARWKQRWLSLLKDDSYFSNLYDEQKKLSGVEKDEFRFEPFTISSWSGPSPSPLTSEEILNISNEELVVRMRKFKTKDPWEGPSVEGFAAALKIAVKENPDKFLDNMKPFEDAEFAFVYEIIDGLEDAWNGKKDIQWGTLLDFITIYINKDEFWNDEYMRQKGSGWPEGVDHEVVAGVIGELITDGTRDDEWAFSEQYLEKAKEILFLLLDKAEADEEDIGSDYVTHSLNSSNGKLNEAFINLARRIARINKKKGMEEEPKWSDEFKSKFKAVLEKGMIEAYTTLGRFMPNFAYLDMSWLKDKINRLSSEKGSNRWEAFMAGYFAVGTVYDELYPLMREHCEYGFDYEFKDEHDREYLIHHICIGYLRGHEKLNNSASLFEKIIDAWKYEQIKDIIHFFWMQRNDLSVNTDENADFKEKIIVFWKWVYENKYKNESDDHLTDNDKKILSNLALLTVFLSKIDSEKFEWLALSAPYAKEDYNSPFFIECLASFDDRESILHAGKLLLKMLEKFTPEYDDRDILSIVQKLYANDGKEIADEICNTYGARGYEFLRDIFYAHNKSQ